MLGDSQERGFKGQEQFYCPEGRRRTPSYWDVGASKTGPGIKAPPKKKLF